MVIMSNREKYFICPSCGDLKTRTELTQEVSSGGYGMCDCKVENASIFTEYDEITKKEYETRLKELMVIK